MRNVRIELKFVGSQKISSGEACRSFKVWEFKEIGKPERLEVYQAYFWKYAADFRSMQGQL